MPGATLGLLDEQLIQQTGHGLVDELAAVIGVKAEDGLCQEDEKSSCCTRDGGGPFGAAL